MKNARSGSWIVPRFDPDVIWAKIPKNHAVRGSA